MSLRFTSVDQLAQCSPAVRAQLEKHLAGAAPDPATSTATQMAEHQARATVKERVARPEQDAGAELVKWVDCLVMPNGLLPGQFFYHVANGGGRSAVEAGILKGQGVRKGWPDYGLDLPAGQFHGLRLELKAPDGGKPTKEQLDNLARLESVGYQCCVAWGFEEAQRYVRKYLDLYSQTTPAAGEVRWSPPDHLLAHE